MIKKKELCLLIGIDCNLSVVKSLGIMHITYPIIYISTEEEFLLKVRTDDALVNNDHSPGVLHTNALRRRTKALLNYSHFDRL